MKILHELNQLEKGGAERVVEGIIKHDTNNQHIVYSYKDGPMRKVLEDAGAIVVIEDPKEEHALEADIIHIHTGGDESKIATAVNGQIPIIETVHSPVVSAVRDEYVYARVGVSKVVTEMNRKCRTIYNGINVDRLNIQAPDFAFNGWKQEINESEVQRMHKTCREYLGIPKNAFVIGRLGRIGFDKCLEEFLVACKKVQDMDYGKEVHVLIVGDEAKSSRGYLAKTKVMVASLPLRNVHFIPALEEVGWAYSAMDVFLYPSPQEGFGLVIAEAMACNVAVITWNSPLNRELFGGSAVLSKGTIESLKNHTIFLMTHKAHRESFASMGCKLATNEYLSEIMSEKYQELYFEIYQANGGISCQDTIQNSH